MTERVPPEALAAEARAATEAVLLAVESGDPEALLEAIETRGRAVQAIAAVIRDDPSMRTRLAEPLVHLDRGAAIAQAALAAVREASREAVATLEGRSAAIRGYDAGAAGSSTLDQPV